MNRTHAADIFSLVVLLLLASSAAYARPAAPAPEIDPSMAVGAFALLAGSIAVLRARLR